MGFFCI